MSHRQYVNLAYNEPSSVLVAYKTIIWTFPGYEISLGTSLAKVGQVEVENNCLTHTHTHYVSLYIYIEILFLLLLLSFNGHLKN